LYVSVVDSDALLIHRAIGLFLWHEEGEKSAMDAADHLNQTEQLISSRSLLVEVNHAASKIAKARKSYPLSAKYLNNALRLLGPEKWTEHYDRSLEMSTFLLELYMACGNSTEVEIVVSEVLAHARCLEDKLPVMVSKVAYLGSMSRYAEAISYAGSVVRLCGKPIPKNPGILQVLLALSTVRRVVARLTDDDIVKLPTVTDTKVDYMLQILSRVASYATMMDRISLRIWCALRAVQLSLEHGLSSATPMALALLGVVEFAFRDVKAAARFGRLSRRLVEERELGPEAKAQAYSLSCFVLHWSDSLDGAISKLPKAGMEAGVLGGDLEHGFLSGFVHIAMIQARGEPLSTVEKAAREVCLQMKEFKVDGLLNLAKPHWQYVLNLLGKSEDPLIFSGEAMDETEHLNDPMVVGSSHQRMILTNQKFRLARLLGSYKSAEQHAMILTKQFKDYPISSGSVVYDIKLNLALLWYHCARESRGGRQKWKYLSKARGEVKFMKRMKAKGCPNFDTILPILEAEEASCVSKDSRAVDTLYEAAITSASGKLHHESIALEQAALFHIGQFDVSAGGEYMRRAVSKYLEWNAYAKVAALVDKFESLGIFIDDNNTVRSMTLYVPTLGGSRSATKESRE